MNRQSTTLPPPQAARSHWLCAATITAVTLLAHGWSLGDGLFLDDHLHDLNLRQARWSLPDFLAGTTIEPARFIQAWWQDKTVRWDYARPATMFWMKAVQAISGGSNTAQHASSIAWHLCCCLMVYSLCFKITRRRGWSLFAAIVFAIYPHNTYAVSWLAAQNAVMQTTLTLAAVICYIRASGLVLHQGAAGLDPRDTSTTDLAGGSRLGLKTSVAAGVSQAVGRRGRRPPREPGFATEPGGMARHQACPPLNGVWFVAVLALFVCGLFSRENAVVFPVLVLAIDLGFGGRRHLLARWKTHLLLMTMAGVFALWRLNLFESHIPTAYLRRPDDWSYPLWYLAKLLHYLACVVWQAPMFVGPMGYRNPFVESAADSLLTVAVVAVFGGAYFVACRKLPGYWIWPLWILLAMLPVVPFLATPHMAYMAGVPFSIALVLKPALAPAGRARLSRAVAVGMLVLSIAAFSVYRLCWRGVLAAERYTIAQMSANPAPAPGSDIFVINLPLANVYLPIILEQAWGPTAEGLRVHVLTYAPHLLIGPKLDQPPARGGPSGAHRTAVSDPNGSANGGISRIEQIDAHSFVLSIEGDHYFAGLLGQLLAEDMRQAGRFRQGDIVHGDLFDARIVEADDRGVQRIEFTFAEPLAGDRFGFYIITDDCPGAEVIFQAQPEDRTQPTIRCANLDAAPDLVRKRDLLFKVIDATAKIIRTDLYLTGRSSGE